MGGRGSSSLSGGSGGGGVDTNETIIIEDYGQQKPENREFASQIEEGFDIITKDFPGMRDTFLSEADAGFFGGKDKRRTLGYYSSADKRVVINADYTDIDKMNKVYDNGGKFHPSRGNKIGAQAVAFHEMGHAVSDYVAGKMGIEGPNALHEASKRIVKSAYKADKGKGGSKPWAGKISGYAQTNYAECVAEAVADYYCNGSKASSASKAIMAELKKYE